MKLILRSFYMYKFQPLAPFKETIAVAPTSTCRPLISSTSGGSSQHEALPRAGHRSIAEGFGDDPGSSPRKPKGVSVMPIECTRADGGADKRVSKPPTLQPGAFWFVGRTRLRSFDGVSKTTLRWSLVLLARRWSVSTFRSHHWMADHCTSADVLCTMRV